MIVPVDISHVRLETERLILRPWAYADLEDLFEYASVPGVGEMAGWPHHTSREASGQILDMFIRGKKTFALELKENGKVIGSLGLEEPDPEPAVPGAGREIGYVLSKDYWGRGLMPEAVNAVIRYCFDTLCFDWLTCGHFLRNDRSRRVIEKCGFLYFCDAPYSTQMGILEASKNYILYHPDK